MKIHLTPGQEAVLRTFADYGELDDVGLAYFVHHKSNFDMSSSGARSRRAELVRAGLLGVSGVTRAKSGRSAAIHSITSKGRRVLEEMRGAVV